MSNNNLSLKFSGNSVKAHVQLNKLNNVHYPPPHTLPYIDSINLEPSIQLSADLQMANNGSSLPTGKECKSIILLQYLILQFCIREGRRYYLKQIYIIVNINSIR